MSTDFTNITESASLYDHLEEKSTLELLTDINREDHKIADAVSDVIPAIAGLVDDILPRMERGGRVFYIGAGTSGRLGVLDASEIPPTYGMPPTLFIGLIAGGDYALRHPVENAEDIADQAWADMSAYDIGEDDSVIGIAASGTTPYVLGGLREANRRGLVTGGITSNPGSPIALTAKEGNRMVDMQLSNKKLVERGTRMLMDYYDWTHDRAQAELLEAGSVRAVLDKYTK